MQFSSIYKPENWIKNLKTRVVIETRKRITSFIQRSISIEMSSKAICLVHKLKFCILITKYTFMSKELYIKSISKLE